MLLLAMLAQTAATMWLATPAFLIPLLSERGLSLGAAGLMASTTTMGMVLTLVAWGALADRFGERWVISGGAALVALAAVGATLVANDYFWLGFFFLLGGMAAASANAASGRLVVGWFPKHRRGLAMGIRQMCQPLGVALAAFIVPPLASGAGIAAATFASIVFCGVIGAACAVMLRDPVRMPTAAASAVGGTAAATPTAATPTSATLTSDNPYRAGSTLVRIHVVSMLLVVPQYTISIFGLVWLLSAQQLDAALAGLVIGLSQFVGAVGRIGVGVLSDRVGSRMRPLRWVALSAVAAMALLALLDSSVSALAVAALVVATTISVADNGLAFVSVAEVAGPRWSGRALGAQNTGQYVAAAAVGPLAGLVIGIAGYPAAFLAAAACALVAVPLVPAAGDSEYGTPAAAIAPRGSRLTRAT